MLEIDAHRLGIDDLRWRCDSKSLGFKTTEGLFCEDEIFGQERALRAIKLGLEVKSPGYNIFIAGLTGTGKSTTIQRLLEKIDMNGNIPDDICYVNNFIHPDQPTVLKLPPGKGKAFARDMARLVGELTRRLPQIFESDEFEKGRKEILNNLKRTSMGLFKTLEERMRREGFAVVNVEMGPVSRPEILPVIDEKVVSWEAVNEKLDKGELSASQVEALSQKHDSLAQDLEKAIRENRVVEREAEKQLQELKYRFTSPLVKDLVIDLKERYAFDRVHDYLTQVEEHVLGNIDKFKEKEASKSQPALLPVLAMLPPEDFVELRVNVVVDNSQLHKVPVIIETAPNYRNLFGTIERVVDKSGSWRSDFTKIKAGALLKANGGYLVMNLYDALVEPGVWTGLKRTLKNRKLDIVVFDPFYLYASSALKPEAVDLDVKVVLIGDAYLYQLLYIYDEDFKKIFKVKADFDSVMPRTDSAILDYAKFVKKICDEEQLLQVTSSGVAEIVEYGVRLGGRKNKLSTRFSDIADLLREADYWARQANSKLVDAAHVQKALDERIFRSRLVEDKIQELIETGQLIIDIEGSKVGQLNGLSVYDLGNYSFGRPSRITAEVSMGQAGIINIEREADLSGKTHNKGVLIIGGYLRGKYAQTKPLSMSASLAFEQSYSGVDGDSASSAEIYALLSELSDLPLRQDIAVTGSVNQKGEIQPIGGVNEKIEGFFEVCNAAGLTGKQGVIIPAQNVDDLMLKQGVLEAVRAGTFHVYAIKTIDQGLEILTGVPAGASDNDRYTKGTVHYLVNERLEELAAGLRDYLVPQEDGYEIPKQRE